MSSNCDIHAATWWTNYLYFIQGTSLETKPQNILDIKDRILFIYSEIMIISIILR